MRPETLIVLQVVEKLPAYYGTGRYITVLQQPSRMNPIHNLPFCFFNIEFNIILPRTLIFVFLVVCFLQFFFSLQKPCMNFSACVLHAPPISSWLTYSNNIWWGVQAVGLLIVQRPVPSSLLHPTCSQTPCVCAFPVMWKIEFHISGAQIQGARMSWRLNLVRGRLKFVGPRHRSCCMTSCWHLEFWGGF